MAAPSRAGATGHGVERLVGRGKGGAFAITGESTPLWSGLSFKDGGSGLSVDQTIAAIGNTCGRRSR